MYYSIIPLNNSFWNSNQVISLTEEQEQSKNHLENKGVNFRDTKSSIYERNLVFDYYVPWSKKDRIYLKKNVKNTVIKSEYNATRSPYMNNSKLDFNTDRIKIAIELYLDRNIYQDSSSFSTNVYLDKLNTYNYLDDSKYFQCYVNIYFDIGEIYRIKLDQRIKETNQQNVRILYDQIVKDMNNDLSQFNKEVDYGKNLSKLEQWNNYIFQRLGIDNMELCNISKSSQEE